MRKGQIIEIRKVGTDRKRCAFYNDTAKPVNEIEFSAIAAKAIYLQSATELHEVNDGRFVNNSEYNLTEPKWYARVEGYMGRPLNGVWASPPYLHNGSVRTIYDLLKKPEDREKNFYVGTRSYDTKNLGYHNYGDEGEDRNIDVRRFVKGVNWKEGDTQELVTYELSTEKINGGHDFGTDLPEREKRALIEYLKTLGEPDELKTSK